MERTFLACGPAVTILIGALPTHAAGFSFDERSTKASAPAGAWFARVDDAAANGYRPAEHDRLEVAQLPFGVNALGAGPDSDFTIDHFGLTAGSKFQV